jgi:hypothetical protein
MSLPLRDTTVQLVDQSKGLIGGYAIVWRRIDNTGRFTADQESDIKWDDKTLLAWCHVASIKGKILDLKKDRIGIQITAQLDEISDQYAGMIQAGFLGYSCQFADPVLAHDKRMVSAYLSEVSLSYCSGCEPLASSLRGFAERYCQLDLSSPQTNISGVENSAEDRSDLNCCVFNKSVVKSGKNRIKLIQDYASGLKSFRKA